VRGNQIFGKGAEGEQDNVGDGKEQELKKGGRAPVSWKKGKSALAEKGVKSKRDFKRGGAFGKMGSGLVNSGVGIRQPSTEDGGEGRPTKLQKKSLGEGKVCRGWW